MKNILLLIKSNANRNRMAILLSAFSGVILCVILYLMGIYFSDKNLSKINIGVMDYDNSILSGDFKSYLSNDLNYKIIEHDSYDYLSEMLIEKEISSIIEIPPDFYDTFASGRDGNIIITSTDDYENAAFLEANMNSYLSGIRLLSVSAHSAHAYSAHAYSAHAHAQGAKETFNRYITEYKEVEIPITKTPAFNMDFEQFKQKEGFRNTIGFFLMIVFALGMVLSFMIIDDRQTGVYNRITVTPVKPVQYIAGNSIFGFLLLMVEIIIYCGYIAIMDINIGFPVYKLFLLMLLLSFFIICYIVDASILIRSKSGISALVMGFSTVGAILGGAYFPLDMAPQSLQNLARVLPQFWFMDALRKLIDDPIADITSNIIILLLFNLLAFLIGAVLFSQNYKKG